MSCSKTRLEGTPFLFPLVIRLPSVMGRWLAPINQSNFHPLQFLPIRRRSGMPPWSPGPLHHSTSGWLRKSPKSGSAKSRPGLMRRSIRRFWDSRPSVFNTAQLKNRVKPMERCDSFLSSSVCETHTIRMGNCNCKRGIATHVFSHVENAH